MAVTSCYVSDALRSACDRGHNWITSRANKIRIMRKGYSRIRPKMLPKGLTEFRKEHCEAFNEDCNEIFLKCTPKSSSVDNESRVDYSGINRNNFVDSFTSMDLHGLTLFRISFSFFSNDNLFFGRRRQYRGKLMQ